jgi:putative FmdB family regulatory protein
MPTYEYECPKCGLSFDRMLPISQYNEPQTCDCGSVATKVISAVGFVLQGDGWPGKNLRIKGQMARKNERITARQNEMKREAPAVTLAPNVNGERAESWADAQKLASSKGLNADSYNAKVREEKAKR